MSIHWGGLWPPLLSLEDPQNTHGYGYGTTPPSLLLHGDVATLKSLSDSKIHWHGFWAIVRRVSEEDGEFERPRSASYPRSYCTYGPADSTGCTNGGNPVLQTRE